MTGTLDKCPVMYQSDNPTFSVEMSYMTVRGVVRVGTLPVPAPQSNLECVDIECS